MGEFVQRLVPDGLWELAEPLILRQQVRRQGGGTRERDAWKRHGPTSLDEFIAKKRREMSE